MPWRLIIFILLLGILVCFMWFNIEHVCTISFGPKSAESLTFKDKPVSLMVIASFLLGMLCSVPFIIGAKVKRKDKPGKSDASPQSPRKWGKKGKENDGGKEALSSGDNSYPEGGPYGVN